MRKLWLTVIAALMVFAIAACGGKSSSLEKVTLVLDWYPNADHAGIFAAKYKGYFTDEGLDVTIQTPSDPTDIPKLVATGKADAGIYYQPDVLLARTAGLQIKAIASIVPVPLNSMQTLKSSGITSPAQLAGKTVGTPGIEADSIYLKTMLKKAGVDPASVNEVNVGFDLLPALLGEKVAATIGAYWNVEAVSSEMQGKPVNVIQLADWGVPTYNELVLVASDDSVKGKRDMLTRLVRAIVKGHQYAVDDPSEAVDFLVKESPDVERELAQRGVELLVKVWKATPAGRMDAKVWSDFAAFMYDNKLIEKQINATDAYTNDFVP